MTNLTVEFVVPEYIERWWPSEGLAGQVFFHPGDGPTEVGGLITFLRNRHGDVLVNVEEILKPVILCRTHIGNVERIVVL